MTRILTALCAAIVFGIALANAEQPSVAAVDAQIQRDLHYHIAELAADVYDGREPGTPLRPPLCSTATP